jgi:hypothetical protein
MDGRFYRPSEIPTEAADTSLQLTPRQPPTQRRVRLERMLDIASQDHFAALGALQRRTEREPIRERYTSALPTPGTAASLLRAVEHCPPCTKCGYRSTSGPDRLPMSPVDSMIAALPNPPVAESDDSAG